MTTDQMKLLFTIGFLVIGLALLLTGVRGLLGYPIVMPTKFSGLNRFTGLGARAAGGVAVFFAVLFLIFSYVIAHDRG